MSSKLLKKEADKNSLPNLSDYLESISDKKAEKIVSLDLKGVAESVCDHFIICEANSTTQVKAIADNVSFHIKKNFGLLPYQTEGYRNCEWVLVDYVDIVIHVFLKERRSFYQLEDLWNDAKITEYDEDGSELTSKE